MIIVRHWSIKEHLQHWLDINNLKDIATVGATPGSKCAELWLLNDAMTNKEFIAKYIKLETKYFIGYLSADDYPTIIHVSFKRK